MQYLVELSYETNCYENYNYGNAEDNTFIVGIVEAENYEKAEKLIIEKLDNSNDYLRSKGIKEFNHSYYDLTSFEDLIDINKIHKIIVKFKIF